MEQNKDQSSAAVRGEAVAEADVLARFEQWKAYPLPPMNSDGHFDKDWLHREFVAFKAGVVSARAADAPSEPSEIAWRDQFWKSALALNCFPSQFIDANEHVFKAVESLKSRAADALDSQPTDPASMTTTERDGYEAGIANKPDPNPYRQDSKYHAQWQRGFDSGRAECLSWDAPASSQPTDGGVRK